MILFIEKAHSFTSEKADTLKTGMRYLCSEGNVSPRDIVFALDCGIKKVWGLLDSIKKKKAKIKDFQWEDFWYGFLLRDDDLYFERAQNDYDKWKEEHDWHDFQTLKDKRTQEILKVLKSGVFSHDVVPVKRDIAKSIITIEEDAIEDGEEIPDNLHVIFSGWRYLKMDNPYNLPEAHVLYKDGTTTANESAVLCTGNCTNCARQNGGCWSLKPGQQILLKQH